MKTDALKTTYTLRMLGGGYLAYLGFSMIGNIMAISGMMQVAEIICASIFTVVGAVLAIISFKSLSALKQQEKAKETVRGEKES